MSLDQETANLRATIIRKNSIQYHFHLIVEPTGFHGLAEIIFYIDSLTF